MNNNEIQIIADGTLLEALKMRLGGVEFSANYTRSGAVLIVYAETLIAGETRRSESGGLKLLQKLLAQPSSAALDIIVLSFRSAEHHDRYGYLFSGSSPIRYNQLPADISLSQ